MPFYVMDYISTTNAFLPYLMEDTGLKGGFRSVKYIADRDSINVFARKAGMLVYVEETDLTYQLSKDRSKWEPFQTGGDGISPDSIASPLMMQDGKLTVDPKVLLPSGGAVGQFPQMQDDGIKWVTLKENINRGVRAIKEYEVPLMQPGDEHNFELDLARSALLIAVKVNAFDIELRGYGTPDRLERNPYTFISSVGYFEDEGIRYDDEKKATYMRRHSIVSNRDEPVSEKIYFTARNIGGAPASVRIVIKYLVLE